EIISTVECECPNHISSIVQSLIEFEDYSEKCFNKNDQDVAIHQHLYVETAKARHIMEQALIKVCEFENITL
ncbi:MAG: MerR family transcriptional regulator, partial [Candidatus Sericytochromatia bacterium]